jgi:hypothetical protein
MIPTQQLRQHVVKLCSRHDISAAGIRGASVRSPLGYVLETKNSGHKFQPGAI